ncbi:hypothetical protein ACFWPV_25800 [Streptomyces uncialis]
MSRRESWQPVARRTGVPAGAHPAGEAGGSALMRAEVTAGADGAPG